MSEEQFVHHVNVFKDPTGGGINQRLLLGWTSLLQHTDLTEDEKAHLFRICNFIAVKLAAVYGHLRQYTAVEDELIARVRAAPPPTPPVVRVVEVSQELFLELDEFLVQLKSTLDYLVKIPIPILGRAHWNLRRFGNEGEDLRRVLERNTPKEHREWAEGVIAQLIDRHKPWLQTAIGLRDELNHYLDGSIPIERFAVYCETPGDPASIRCPIWAGTTTLRAALETLWRNLFLLVEDFVPFFLDRRRHKGFAFYKHAEGADSTTPLWHCSLDEQALAGLQRATAQRKQPSTGHNAEKT